MQAIGAVPVLVTSLSRRTFKDGKVVEDLKDYAAATKKVGAEEFVTVVDLNAQFDRDAEPHGAGGGGQVQHDGAEARARRRWGRRRSIGRI